MHRILVTAFVVVLFSFPAFASDQVDAFSIVERFVEAWNKNDAATVANLSIESLAIIDEFPPHLWQGPNALVEWGKDYDAESKRIAATDAIVTLSKPTVVEANGSYAYVVVPAVYSFVHNAQRSEDKGIITVALRKLGQNWRVAALTWTKQ